MVIGGGSMREIVFRGKTANGVWVHGSLAYSDNIEPAIYFEVGKGSVKTFDFVYVRPETVGQFTGLIDKNGNKIFEGDILSNKTAMSMYSEYGEKYTVKYCDDLGKFECDYQFGIERYLKIGCEVIGNIHDNPDLLSDKKS